MCGWYSAVATSRNGIRKQECAVAVPQPTAHTSEFVIDWDGVRILPRDTRAVSSSTLVWGKDPSRGSHYYAARETDANLLAGSRDLGTG